MTAYKFAFIVIAALTIGSALMVVTLKNILRSALFLAFAFLGVAGIYILANAEFLAAMQVLIYVGAITVLIMFGIVLTQQLMGASIRQSTRVGTVFVAAPIVLLVFAFLVKVFVKPFGAAAGGMIQSTPKPTDADTLQQIAHLLIQPYVLPFELASLILLAALVGAIVMAKEERN
jgi:NADH-quinone oxidoreductase subunit J